MQSAGLTADAPHPGPASSRFRVRPSLASRIQFHFCRAHAALLHLTLPILTRRRPFYFLFFLREVISHHIWGVVSPPNSPPLAPRPWGDCCCPLNHLFPAVVFFIRCHVCVVTPLCDPWYRRPILMGLQTLLYIRAALKHVAFDPHVSLGWPAALVETAARARELDSKFPGDLVSQLGGLIWQITHGQWGAQRGTFFWNSALKTVESRWQKVNYE